MKNKTLTMIILLLIVALKTNANVQEQISKIQSHIANEKKQLLEIEIKKRGILGVLYEINKNLNKLTSDISSLQKQLSDTSNQIENYAKVIARLDSTRITQKEKLRERLRALYKMGFQGYTEVLLTSQTSSEFSRNIKFLKIIAKHDVLLINNYKNTLAKLERQQIKLKKQVKVYVGIQEELKVEKVEYQKQKDIRVALINEIEKNRETHLLAIREWREAGLKLEEQWQQLGGVKAGDTFMKGSFFEYKGTMKNPVMGDVVVRYGLLKNDKFNTQIFHKGMFFGAEKGRPVSSIFNGKVAYAGWINGYGQTLIIDHGDHYYSLYAHNSKLEKTTGDSVARDELIALSGDSGSLRGSGLYLEIRHFSDALDPAVWLDLKRNRRQL